MPLSARKGNGGRRKSGNGAGLRAGASRQKQDLRDYGIFRILTALVRIRLGGIFGCGETRKMGETKYCKS